MGLSNYPSAAEGVIPLIVMNTVMSVALLKNMFRSVLEAIGATSTTSTTTTYTYQNYPYNNVQDTIVVGSSNYRRKVCITQYKFLCQTSDCGNSSNKSFMAVECCVCLSGFEENQEVSELPCKHFFHRGCLDKWFENRHSTCPLCRSYYYSELK